MSDNVNTLAGAYQDLVEGAETELEQVRKELKEIDILIRQSTGEVDKLSQRSAQLATKLHQMEANLDAYPRQDIKDVYSSSLEAQMRLFMMRGQVEQLQSKQESLTRYGNLLRRIMGTASQEPAAGAEQSPHGQPGGQELSFFARVIESQERERQRLARQMHDGPAQSLTNLILQAEICERLLDSDVARARDELTSLRNAVNTTFQEVREFIFDLRPMMLDDLGLVPTLRRYISDFEQKTRLATNVQFVGQERRLPAHVEVTVFRVVQGVLTNTHQHAHASNVQVSLELKDSSVLTGIEDDGSGFDVEDALNSSPQRIVGLATMREQVEMLGGRFQIESGIGQGTRTTFEIPIS